jgi:plasmid replication initiation protein
MTYNDITEFRDKTVIKANELIQRSRFNLSLQEQKVILYLISQIEYADTDFKLYDFSIVDFCRVCGIETDNGKNYINLKNTLKEIADKSVWIKLDDKRETIVRWIEKPYIDYGSGIVQIKLDKDMKPFLLQLKEKYTQYELIYTLHFKSKYTIRLYEFIKSIHFHELDNYEKVFDIEELKRILGAENYKQTRDFKKRAFLPAVKEINLYSDKDLQFEEITRGRKITHLKLIIGTKEITDRLKIRAEIEKEMGAPQLTLWNRLAEDSDNGK